MAAVPYSVAEAFVRGDKGKSGAFTTDGRDAYSYGLLLATRTPEGVIIIMHDFDNKRSVTTARHIRALAHVLGTLPPERVRPYARRDDS